MRGENAGVGVPGQERPRYRRSDAGGLALVRQLRSGKQGLQRQAKKSRRTDCGAGGGALSRRQVAFCHWPKSPTACCGGLSLHASPNRQISSRGGVSAQGSPKAQMASAGFVSTHSSPKAQMVWEGFVSAHSSPKAQMSCRDGFSTRGSPKAPIFSMVDSSLRVA